MAVYTVLSKENVIDLLSQYSCGVYLNHQGITGGIENTNYYVNTDHKGTVKRFVLTVFEVLTEEQLPYYLELTAHFKSHGLSVSAPCRLNNGHLMTFIHNKPVALAECLAGSDVMPPTVNQCGKVGELLAQLHKASETFTLRQANLRGLAWWQTTVPTLYAKVSPEIAGLLADELHEQTQYAQTPTYHELPTGAVHADLFCNNVLIAPDGNAGAIDFFFAGDDTYVFDICVTMNDWCLERDYDVAQTGDLIRSNGHLNTARFNAFMSGYQNVRPLLPIETLALPMMARAAAFRFWVSRLNDWYKPRSATQLIPHDPAHFERVLRSRRENAFLI